MPIDPNIALSVQTPQPSDPLAQYSRVVQLQSAMQGQQVQQAQLTGLNQENQMRGIQMDQMQKLNQFYRASLNGDGTIDGGKLSQAMAAGGLGSRIPDVMKGITEYQQSLSNLAKSRLEVGNLQADAAGGLAAGVQAAGNDPHVYLTHVQAAVDAKALPWQQVAPQVQAVQKAMQQDIANGDTHFSSARSIVAGYAQEAINGSEKWKALQIQQQQADAQKTRAAGIAQDANINQQKFMASEQARLLGSATNQATWDAGRAQLIAKGADPASIDSLFTPQKAQQYANSGKSPHELNEEADSATRLKIEQQNATTNANRAGGVDGTGVSATTNALLAQKNAGIASAASKDEIRWDNINTQIRQAISGGQNYAEVGQDGNVKLTPFSKLIPQGNEDDPNYATRKAAAIQSYQQQMNATVDTAIQRANLATKTKNDAYDANGQPYSVTTEQAAAARLAGRTPAAKGGNPNPATTTKAPPPAAPAAPKPGANAGPIIGMTFKSADGKTSFIKYGTKAQLDAFAAEAGYK